jgi:hypothetical protein
MSSVNEVTNYDLQGKTIWIEFIHDFNKIFDDIYRASRKNPILLLRIPNPLPLYLSNVNKLSWEENTSISIVGEEILTIWIAIMDHNMCKIRIVYI